MAGDWIKMRADLFTHPKVFRLAELLGKDELYTVGALFCFWAWADKHCVDGLVDGATSRLIDRATRVDGFSEALIAVGWLEIDDAGAHIPRFGEHNGDTAKERSLKNQRQARWRAGKTLESVDGRASTSTPTKASTREEKRREEISVPNGTGGEAAKTPEELTKAELWQAGKSLLEAAGMAKAQCGSFVGKLVKDYGDAVVVEAVRAAVVAQPADPVEYLKASCQRTAGRRQPFNKQVAIEQRNKAVMEEWLAGEGVTHAAV